jgi:hypothetical protein
MDSDTTAQPYPSAIFDSSHQVPVGPSFASTSFVNFSLLLKFFSLLPCLPVLVLGLPQPEPFCQYFLLY